MIICKPKFTEKDVEILAEKELYRGYFTLKLLKLRHKIFAGGWSQPFMRELSIRYNAVTVLPYDPKLKKVVLIEQFRVGIMDDTSGPWSLELVAGVIDKDHTKEEIARLEAKEEAGLEIIKLTPVYEYWSSPGGSTERVKLFCAVVDASKASGIHGLKEEHEDILVHVVDCQDAFAAVRSGRINNAMTMLALQWLELNLDKYDTK